MLSAVDNCLENEDLHESVSQFLKKTIGTNVQKSVSRYASERNAI